MVGPTKMNSEKLYLEKRFLLTNIVHFIMEEHQLPDYNAHTRNGLRAVIADIRNAFQITDIDIEAGVKIDLLTKIFKKPDKQKEQLHLRGNYYCKKGDNAFEQKNFDAALEYCKRAVECEPDSPSFLITLAKVHLKYGHVAKVLKYCKRALELDSECHQAYGTLGELFLRQNYLKNALDCFDKANYLYPDNKEYKDFLQKTLKKCQIILEKDSGGLHRRYNLENLELLLDVPSSKRLIEIQEEDEIKEKSEEKKEEPAEDISLREAPVLRINPSIWSLVQKTTDSTASVFAVFSEAPRVTKSLEDLCKEDKDPAEEVYEDPVQEEEELVIPDNSFKILDADSTMFLPPLTRESWIAPISDPPLVEDLSSTTSVYEYTNTSSTSASGKTSVVSEGLSSADILAPTSDAILIFEGQGIDIISSGNDATTESVGVLNSTVTVATSTPSLQQDLTTAVTEPIAVSQESLERSTTELSPHTTATETIIRIKRNVATNTETIGAAEAGTTMEVTGIAGVTQTAVFCDTGTNTDTPSLSKDASISTHMESLDDNVSE